MKEANGQPSAPTNDAVWQKSQYANLVRYVPSGIYFTRSRIGGKLIRRSLRTKVLSVAKLKLADLEKEERSKLENVGRIDSGRLFLATSSPNIAVAWKPTTASNRERANTTLNASTRCSGIGLNFADLTCEK
jgi:hypothetical protein